MCYHTPKTASRLDVQGVKNGAGNGELNTVKALVKIPGKQICAALVISATWMCTASTDATVLVRLGITDLAVTSPLIIEGMVKSVDQSFATKNGGIETRVVIRVQERWKGNEEIDRVTLRLPGGVHGEQIHVVPGAPDFIVGEAVLLFLEPVEDGWIPTGLGQGVFRIGNRGLERTINQAAGEGMFVEIEGGKAVRKTTPPGPTTGVPYRQFRKEVEFLIGKDSVEKPAAVKPVILP